MPHLPDLIPDPTLLPLQTRVFTCFFDQGTGFLRRLSIGRTEVIRAIYGAVRDRVWNTVPSVISEVRTRSSEDEFDLAFEVDCRDDSAHFRWTGRVHARGGRLEFTFDGEALTTFQRNRIGLCVLHPLAGCTGRPCRIVAPDGTAEDAAFPGQISPHQPFKNLHAMAWSPAPGIDADLSFEGEIFETEDQRNWSDASFKTYGTPLALPFPVLIERGTKVRQVARFSVSAASVELSQTTGEDVIVLRAQPERSLPKPAIGLCIPAGAGPLTARETDLLRKLALTHLRVDLYLAGNEWQHVFARAQKDAVAIDSALHCALHLTDDTEDQLKRFAEAARGSAAQISLVLLFQRGHKVTPPELPVLARERLASLGADVAIGTNEYFAELNRNRPIEGSILCFSLNPQVHAFDDLSLIENLEAQQSCVATALGFGADEVAISPITLRPRFNQHIGDQAEEPGVFADNIDARQRMSLGAVWTLGSLARLAPMRGVHSLTYYETIGCRGLIEEEIGARLPDVFPSRPGEIFPVYEVFAALAGAARVFPVEVREPLKVTALGLETETGQRRLLVGNLRPRNQRIRVAEGSVSLLDPYAFEVIHLDGLTPHSS